MLDLQKIPNEFSRGAPYTDGNDTIKQCIACVSRPRRNVQGNVSKKYGSYRSNFDTSNFSGRSGLLSYSSMTGVTPKDCSCSATDLAPAKTRRKFPPASPDNSNLSHPRLYSSAILAQIQFIEAGILVTDVPMPDILMHPPSLLQVQGLAYHQNYCQCQCWKKNLVG